MDSLDLFLKKYSYKFPKGYPDMENPKDKEMLFEMVKKLTEEETDVTKDDLIKLIQDLDLDDKQIKKLYDRTKNFTTYRPIKSTLQDKDYNELVLKKFSKEIQDLIEGLPKNEVDNFVSYLTDKEKQIDFPKNLKGNLYTTIAKTGVPDSIVKQIVSHTSTDEGKKGVGMGELGLSLIFKNVKAAKGKGDLSIDDGEFEIKGESATLGDKPLPLSNVINAKLKPFGINIEGGGQGKIQFKDKTYNKNNFAEVLSDIYKDTDNKSEFKDIIKDILINDNGLGNEAVNTLFDKIDFSSKESIQTNIALMNFIRYAQKEGFKHFLSHDFGQSKSGKGDYIYVSGSPEEMANQLKQAGAKFEKISPNNLRPRIGFSSNLVAEDEE